jgi:hypothetical protein
MTSFMKFPFTADKLKGEFWKNRSSGTSNVAPISIGAIYHPQLNPVLLGQAGCTGRAHRRYQAHFCANNKKKFTVFFIFIAEVE